MKVKNDIILDATVSSIPNPQGIITGTWVYTDEQTTTGCGYTGLTAGKFSIYNWDTNLPADVPIDASFFTSMTPTVDGNFVMECSILSNIGVDYTRDFSTLTNFWGQCSSEATPVRGTVALTSKDKTMTFQIYQVIDTGVDRLCVFGVYIEGDTTILTSSDTKITIQIVKMAFTFRGDWELGGSYTYNDIVNYDGKQWVMSSDFEMTSSPDTPDIDSNWTLYSPTVV